MERQSCTFGPAHLKFIEPIISVSKSGFSFTWQTCPKAYLKQTNKQTKTAQTHTHTLINILMHTLLINFSNSYVSLLWKY